MRLGCYSHHTHTKSKYKTQKNSHNTVWACLMKCPGVVSEDFFELSAHDEKQDHFSTCSSPCGLSSDGIFCQLIYLKFTSVSCCGL